MMSFARPWSSSPFAMSSALYLFIILSTSTLDATSGEQRTGGHGAFACPAASSWFGVMRYDNASLNDSGCVAVIENGTTALTLNASASGILSDGSNVSETGMNDSCRYRWLEQSIQTVKHVTFIGKLFNGSLSLASCFPRLNHVTVLEADLGPLTRTLVDELGSNQLDEFDLSSNGITNVTQGVFDWKLRHLKVIDLSRNLLSVIDNDSFVDLFSLRLVNLSHNAIYRVERAAFVSTLSPLQLLTYVTISYIYIYMCVCVCVLINWNGVITLGSFIVDCDLYKRQNVSSSDE